MERTGQADGLIKSSGCGPFQVLMVLFVDVIIKIGLVYSIVFMAFGNYNPGWRCLDQNTSALYNYSMSLFQNSSGDLIKNNTISSESTQDNDTTEYTTEGSCGLFEACQNIQFNPETSTIVTEWGLTCQKSWILSLIISIQMAGVLVGSLISGQLGDTFGRKRILYIALALLGALSLATMFATHWQVFAVLRFFIGAMIACLYNLNNILTQEYLSPIWRTRLAASPAWPFGGMLLGVAGMMCKDWKTLHLIVGVYCIISCIPALWVPESLRWLEVKHKSKDFQKAAKTIVTINKLPQMLENYDSSYLENLEKSQDKPNTRVYTMFDLFRKGYRLYTVVLSFLWFSPALSYYAINFGVQSMYGDFYVNLLVLFAADIPYAVFPMHLPYCIGRKKASILFTSLTATTLLAAASVSMWAPTHIRNTAIVILALAAKVNITSSLSCFFILATEIYPTVVRSNAIGYFNSMARVGGTVAPLLIPTDSKEIPLCYGIMGAMALTCSLLMIKIPETNGTNLKQFFDED